MDDVALFHEHQEQLQEMLNTTQEVAQRFRIKFGKEKSQIININNKEPPPYKLGEMELDMTNKYKYLGMVINNKGTMEDHITSIKGKVEASTQTILNIAGYNNFNKIQMEIIWKLVNTCIIPIVTYAAEAWIPTQKEIKDLQKIVDNVIKRILNAPITTPSESIRLETGIESIETAIDRKQIMYYHKVRNNTNDSNVQRIMTDRNNEWAKKLSVKLNKYNITEQEIMGTSKNQFKKTLNKKINDVTEHQIKEKAEHKSKVKHIIDKKNQNEILKTPAYIKHLTRRDCSNIFAVRSRMIKLKTNYRNAHEDMICRWCKGKDETQEHIFMECPKLRKITSKIDYHKIMSDLGNPLKKEAKMIEKLIQAINTENDNNVN